MLYEHHKTNPLQFQDHADLLFQEMSDYPGPSWAPAAAAAAQEARDLNHEVIAYEQIVKPPSTLASAHANYIEALVGYSNAYGSLAADLRAQNLAGVTADFAAIDSSTSSGAVHESAWRLAVLGQCERLHVPVPAWVKRIGAPPPK